MQIERVAQTRGAGALGWILLKLVLWSGEGWVGGSQVGTVG